MNDEAQQNTKLRRYLLGELSLEEQVVVEQRLFLDSEYAELGQAVEDDLIDEYLHDDLAAAEREKFESHFLRQPEHSEDLRIAAALKKHLSSESIRHLDVGPDILRPEENGSSSSLISEAGQSSGESDKTADSIHRNEPGKVLRFPILSKPIVRWSVAAAVLIILSIVAWKMLPSLRGLTGDEPLQAGEPQPTKPQPQERQQPGPVVPDNQNAEETTQERDSINHNTDKPVKRPPQATQFATFIITPGGVARGGGGRNIVTITDELQGVILRLPLTLTDYDKYRVDLLTGDRTIYRREISTTEMDAEYGPVVSITMPVRMLRERNYQLRLRGVKGEQSSPPTTYAFVVDRE